MIRALVTLACRRCGCLYDTPRPDTPWCGSCLADAGVEPCAVCGELDECRCDGGPDPNYDDAARDAWREGRPSR